MTSVINLPRPSDATVPGTCGEWIQGWLAGEPVLVSCPIDRYVQVTASPNPNGRLHLPPSFSKATQAAQQVYKQLQGANGFTITIDNPLPRGRGYASSTADIVGVSTALANALGGELSPECLGQLACAIEPSDSLMFPGLAVFAYRSGVWHQALGPDPRLPLLILDPGTTLDTIAYNQSLNLQQLATLEVQTQEALTLLTQGLQQQRSDLLGAASTLSALSYQRIHPSPFIEQASYWAKTLGALGIIRAHSGSIVGLLFSTEAEAIAAQTWLRSRFEGDLLIVQTTDGGAKISTVPTATPAPHLLT